MTTFTMHDKMKFKQAERNTTVFPNIPIYSHANKLFIKACNNNDIAVATLLAIMRPDCYYVCVINV